MERAPYREEILVEEGTPAPDFTLPSDTGETVRLSDFRGKRVVLYFYSKDDTPGCTKQACGIRDAWDAFRETDAVVLGVSPDDEVSHRRFKQKYSLPFALLSDVDHAVADTYGVWRERSMYGKKSMGIKRSTFVIDEDGRVARAVYGVKPDEHADLVLGALDAKV